MTFDEGWAAKNRISKTYKGSPMVLWYADVSPNHRSCRYLSTRLVFPANSRPSNTTLQSTLDPAMIKEDEGENINFTFASRTLKKHQTRSWCLEPRCTWRACPHAHYPTYVIISGYILKARFFCMANHQSRLSRPSSFLPNRRLRLLQSVGKSETRDQLAAGWNKRPMKTQTVAVNVSQGAHEGAIFTVKSYFRKIIK